MKEDNFVRKVELEDVKAGLVYWFYDDNKPFVRLILTNKNSRQEVRKFNSSDIKVGQVYFFANILKVESNSDYCSRVILTLPDSRGDLSVYCFSSNRICEFNVGKNLASFSSCFVYR